MPVIFPVSILFGSCGTLFYIISRRLKIVKRTLDLQQELIKEQKKIDRAIKRQNRRNANAIRNLRRASEQKHKALRNLGATNELMKKVDHDLTSGNHEEALQTLIQIISLDPHHRKGNELLAKLYLESNQNKKAELIYKKLIEWYPLHAPYYASIAESYLNRHQFKASTEAYKKALHLDKNNYSRYADLGKVYSMKKEYGTALEYFIQAHRLNVRDIDLMFFIVDLCLQNSDPITAREYLHKILDYEPYNQQAKSLLGEVLRDLQEA